MKNVFGEIKRIHAPRVLGAVVGISLALAVAAGLHVTDFGSPASVTANSLVSAGDTGWD